MAGCYFQVVPSGRPSHRAAKGAAFLTALTIALGVNPAVDALHPYANATPLTGTYSVDNGRHWLAILGDSNGAGGGAGSYDRRSMNGYTGCFASTNAAGILVAANRGWDSYNLGCSGATSKRFFDEQLPKFTELVRDHGAPSVIVLSLGGNQPGVNLPGLLQKVLFDQFFDPAQDPGYKTNIGSVSNDLISAIRALQRVTKNQSLIVVEGLPDIFDVTQHKPVDLHSATGAAGFQEVVTAINEQMKMAAGATGTLYLDISNVIPLEHRAGGRDKPWVNTLDGLDFLGNLADIAARALKAGNTDFFPDHLNELGQRAVAGELNGFLYTSNLDAMRGGHGLN